MLILVLDGQIPSAVERQLYIWYVLLREGSGLRQVVAYMS